MSDKHYFQYGGTISRSSSYTTSVTLSVSLAYTLNWTVASIEATAGVSGTVSNTIGTSASWTVPAKKFAQIFSVIPRKEVALSIFTWDGEPLSRVVRYPGQPNGKYITAKFS